MAIAANGPLPEHIGPPAPMRSILLATTLHAPAPRWQRVKRGLRHDDVHGGHPMASSLSDLRMRDERGRRARGSMRLSSRPKPPSEVPFLLIKWRISCPNRTATGRRNRST